LAQRDSGSSKLCSFKNLSQMATCFDGCFEGIFGSPQKGGFGGSRTPFIVITRITTGDGKRNEYLKVAKAVAETAKQSEPGMLHQTFDADPTDGTKFVWTQVYQNDAALMKHLKNEAYGDYLSKHGEIGKNYTVEVYGTVGADVTGALKRSGFPVKFFSSKLGYTTVDKVDPEAKARSLFSSSTPFIVLGRVTTKPGKADEYTKLARLTSKEVKESEAGTVHQSFDADPSDRTKLVWSEVYQNDSALLANLKNAPFGEYLTQHAELATDISFEVYGTVGDEVKNAIRKKGISASYFKTQVGSSRV